MKNTIKNCLFMAVLLMGGILVLSGCGKKMTTLSYTSTDPKATISMSYEEGSPYTFIEAEKEGGDKLRTSSEDAGIVADDFLISFEVVEYFFSDDTFEKKMEEAKTKEQFTEVKYNGISGFSKYYPSYVRYEVYLPIDEKCYLQVNVYYYKNGEWTSAETDADAKATFESEKVQAILDTIKIN